MKPLLALLPLVCVVLAGGTAPWSEAVMLVLVGAGLVAAPPRHSLGWRLNAVLLALLALALTAFLPAAWFRLPAWRAALTDDLQTPLPGTLSPQPWLSADAIAVFALAWAGSTRWRRRPGRRRNGYARDESSPWAWPCSARRSSCATG